MSVSAHQKGKRFLQGSGVLTRHMYRNILSVAIIYTNYDPKPHPPGVNIWAVIHASFQNHYQIFSNEIKRDTPQKLTPSRRLMRFATQFVWKIWRFWDSSNLLKKTLGPEACRALLKKTLVWSNLASFRASLPKLLAKFLNTINYDPASEGASSEAAHRDYLWPKRPLHFFPLFKKNRSLTSF